MTFGEKCYLAGVAIFFVLLLYLIIDVMWKR
jgi:hypothetical protein